MHRICDPLHLAHLRVSASRSYNALRCAAFRCVIGSDQPNEYGICARANDRWSVCIRFMPTWVIFVTVVSWTLHNTPLHKHLCVFSRARARLPATHASSSFVTCFHTCLCCLWLFVQRRGTLPALCRFDSFRSLSVCLCARLAHLLDRNTIATSSSVANCAR